MSGGTDLSIWLIGNTGLRNPTRIQEGFKTFAESPFVGHLHGRDNELAFENYLNDHGIIHRNQSTKSDGTYARKWRLMFGRYGLIYEKYNGKDKDGQKKLGDIDTVTPFGKTFLLADTLPSVQECFLRSLGVEQYKLESNKKLRFSPFRWILAIMLKLEERTGSSEIKRLEFALWGQTTNPENNVNEVVDSILDLRERRKKSQAKKKFDRNERLARTNNNKTKAQTINDYCDMNMRYLRISGIIQRKGRGLIINPAKHIIAEKMASTEFSNTSLLESMMMLTKGAPLPTDNETVARKVLKDLEEVLQKRHIVYDISDLPLESAFEINVARNRLEELLAQTDEVNYAKEQPHQWKEISDYMSLLIKGGGKKEYGDDNIIEVPKDEMPAYLEWTLWRAALAVDHLVNKPYEIRGFRLDSDFLPVSAAGGGKGDLYCEFENGLILTEVTMSSSSRQEAMEGEPVRRHISDAVLNYDKPVYGLFIAIHIDTNTAETFRHGVWYAKGDLKQRLNIVPLTLAQFQRYFEQLFETDSAKPEKFVELILRCVKERDHLEAPEWKNYIDTEVKASINHSMMN